MRTSEFDDFCCARSYYLHIAAIRIAWINWGRNRWDIAIGSYEKYFLSFRITVFGDISKWLHFMMIAESVAG